MAGTELPGLVWRSERLPLGRVQGRKQAKWLQRGAEAGAPAEPALNPLLYASTNASPLPPDKVVAMLVNRYEPPADMNLSYPPDAATAAAIDDKRAVTSAMNGSATVRVITAITQEKDAIFTADVKYWQDRAAQLEMQQQSGTVCKAMRQYNDHMRTAFTGMPMSDDKGEPRAAKGCHLTSWATGPDRLHTKSVAASAAGAGSEGSGGDGGGGGDVVHALNSQDERRLAEVLHWVHLMQHGAACLRTWEALRARDGDPVPEADSRRVRRAMAFAGLYFSQKVSKRVQQQRARLDGKKGAGIGKKKTTKQKKKKKKGSAEGQKRPRE